MLATCEHHGERSLGHLYPAADRGRREAGGVLRDSREPEGFEDAVAQILRGRAPARYSTIRCRAGSMKTMRCCISTM